jgi:hypothetical protein
MIATFSASSYGWMTATLGTCKKFHKKNIGGNTIPVQIMGEWKVMETYPYLLLKTQEQVFTAGSTKGYLLFFFLVCTWRDISPPQNRFMMPGPTHTLRRAVHVLTSKIGTYRALS